MKYLIPFVILGLLTNCNSKKSESSQNSIVEGEAGHKLDSLLTPYLQELRTLTDNTAGLAIGIIQNDQIIYAKTFGYSDVTSATSTTLNTPFHIASVSKPFTAMAIAKLVQDGKLDLDDPIVKHIPEFEMAGEGHELITIKHILTHTSGIPRNIAPDDWLLPSFGPEALEENLAIVSKHELEFEPDTRFSYSNSAFDILGIVISQASGLPFHDYINQEFFIPIGMRNASFLKPSDIQKSTWAMPHSYGLETQEITPFPYNERLFPSSGVVASLSDMCQWGKFHLGKGSIDGKQILDAAHFELAVSPHFDTPWGDKIGLSWFLQSYLDRPIIMHTGADTGFESIMYVYPEENISIVVLANRDFSRTGRIINAASEIFFNESPKTYQVSAKYQFAKTYNEAGIAKAIDTWEALKKDTLDNYYVDDEEILTTGAILENGGEWQASKEILEYYLTLDQNSTYAWRLLGNDNLNLGDTLAAKNCYEQTLIINPNYEKGRMALESLR